jgi:hypothetical protein
MVLLKMSIIWLFGLWEFGILTSLNHSRAPHTSWKIPDALREEEDENGGDTTHAPLHTGIASLAGVFHSLTTGPLSNPWGP